MLHFFVESNYQNGNRRTTNAIEFTRYLKTRLEQMQSRHRASQGYAHAVVGTIEHMLSLLDLEEITDIKTDLKRLSTFFTEDMVAKLNSVLGENFYTKTYRGSIVTNPQTTVSIVPISMTDYIKNVPLDKPIKDWHSVRPLRILSHNSTEYTLSINNDQITFNNDAPTYMLLGIDVVALGLKYAHFRLEDKTTRKSVFVHRYVIDGLMEDLQDIWLRNQVISSINNRLVVNNNRVIENDTYNYIGHQFVKFVSSLNILKSQLEAGALYPRDFMASIPLPRMFYDEWIVDRFTKTDMPDRRQSLWVPALRDLPDIELLVKVHNRYGEFGDAVRFRLYLRRRLEIYRQNNVWDFPNRVIGRYLKQEYERIEELCK